MMNARARLLASTLLVGATAFAAPAFAQVNVPQDQVLNDGQTATPTTDTDPSVDGTGAPSSEIVVTGTLIQNPNLERSQPVNVTTSEELELRQTNLVEQILREIPGIVPNVGTAVNNGNGGASFVDLRGLGANRNLVLLDGRRLTPAGLDGVVDLNNIPVALVDRVDVTTGGQVTTYGADAITGVVNFVTKRDFSGVELQANQQITEEGDGNFFRFDATVGANIEDGRGNAVLSIGYQEADAVFQGDRKFSSTNYDSFSPIPAFAGSGTTTPSVFTNVVPGNPGARRQINPATGLTGAVTPFNFNPFNIFQTPFERFNLFASARYEVNDSIEFYTRGLFSKNTVQTIVAPSGVFSSDVSINLNNPFLPAGLRGQFCATTGLTAAQCSAAAAATGPADPNYRTVTTNLRRRVVEAGPRISNFQTTIFDYRLGLRGALSESINYDVNAAYGESDRPQTLQGYVLTSRVRQALLANSPTACQDTSNGCTPLNIFGETGSITPDMVDFITGESTTTVRTSLAQATATVNGDFGIASPAAEQPIGFAIGGEYRKYTAQQASDSLAQQAGELGGAGGAAPNIRGGYDVYEALGELVVPLVEGKRFFESLTVEAGARYSSYSVDAPGSPSFDTFTWKAGGTYEPVDGVKFRGNYSRAVRAPNIDELFSPFSVGLTNLSTDPCAEDGPVGNAVLTAVCVAQGAPASAIGFIENPTAGQANNTTSGSTALRPEKANTYSLGVVFQPDFFPGFSASVDYYNIKIKRAITAPTPFDVVQACFSNLTAASATNPACTSIRRNPTTGALDGDPSTTAGLPQPTRNTGRLATDGIDATFNFQRKFGGFNFALSASGNYTFNSKFQAVPGSLNRECTGYYSVNCSFTGSIQPEFTSNVRGTLGFDGVDISLLWRHLSGMTYEGQAPDGINRFLDEGDLELFSGTLGFGPLSGRDVNFNRIPAYDFFDLATRFEVNDNTAITITVVNLLDKKPPIVGSTAGSTAFNSGNTYPSTYDALGRRYGVTARLRF